MYLIYNGIHSDSLNADIIVGENKFQVSPSYRINTKKNEANDGDINYTTYNNAGRMLANSREISSQILIRRKVIFKDGVSELVSRSKFMNDVSEVVEWLKSDDYKPLVIGEIPEIEWQAIAVISSDKPEIYTDGVIINVTFECNPFTTRYSLDGLKMGSSISTDSEITVYGKSAYEEYVSNSMIDYIEYKGTAISYPTIKIGSASNKAIAKSKTVSVSIDGLNVSVDVKSGQEFYCVIDTKNYMVYINNVLSNDKVHIGRSMPYLMSNKENKINVSGFIGNITLDFKELYDLSYLWG